MRTGALAVMLLAVASSAASARSVAPQQSNPAFLGISFGPSPIGCVIESVTAGGPADDAGFRPGDVITAIDTTAIVAERQCDEVMTAITAHGPGDTVAVEIKRMPDGQDGDPVITLHPVLATRSEVLMRRIGRRVEATDLADVDGARRWNLGERTGRTLVVGAFSTSCAACIGLVDRVAEQLEQRLHADVTTLAVTSSHTVEAADLLRLRSLRGIAPLAVADDATFDNFAMGDHDRTYFFVIDCRGVVRLVAPISPDADDVDAATDEVIAAVGQAEHARARR